MHRNAPRVQDLPSKFLKFSGGGGRTPTPPLNKALVRIAPWELPPAHVLVLVRGGCNTSLVLYSSSYAEDVTSVTSGASQGPHSFNLVFVCLFVSRLALSRICPVPYRTIKHSWLQTRQLATIFAGAIPYLSRTVPYHQTQPATNSSPQYSSYYVYDSLMYREIFWKEIGRRGGNAIILDVSCQIGDRMRQRKDKNILWKRDPVVSKISVNGRVSAGHRKRR